MALETQNTDTALVEIDFNPNSVAGRLLCYPLVSALSGITLLAATFHYSERFARGLPLVQEPLADGIILVSSVLSAGLITGIVVDIGVGVRGFFTNRIRTTR